MAKKIIILMMIFVGALLAAPDVGLPIQKRARQAAPLQAVFAADTTWGFDSASQYTYDTSVIEVTGGVARLKDLGGTIKDDSIVEYNSAFVAGDTTRGYSGTTAGADVSLVLETASATLYKASGTFTSRVFDTASGTGAWQRINATVVNGDIPNADSLFDSGLVGLWHFNNSWNDSKGTNHGEPVYATFSASAKLGPACVSFGGGEYNRVSVGEGSGLFDFGSGDFSISFWMRPNSYPVNYIRTLGKASGNNWENGYAFAVLYQVFGFWVNGQGNAAVTSLPTTGNWHHVVGSYNHSSIGLYIDGIEANSVNYTQDVVDTDLPFWIGSISSGGNGDFGGQIDEVAIWNRALDSSEVADHYNSGVGKELHRAAKFQVNSGDSLPLSGAFVGPLGNSTSYYTGANETLVSGGGFDTTHRFAQYKAYLNGSTDSTRTPTVASVALVGTAGAQFDNTKGDFDLGAYSTTNASVVVGRSSFVGLSKMPNGGYNSYGTYTSRIIDGGVGPNWSTLNFTTGGTEIDASENGLVGLWHLNGSQGNSAPDASGNENNGTLTNMDTTLLAGDAGNSGWNSSGKFNNCLKFDGGDDFVGVADADNLEMRVHDLTFSHWFKTSQRPASHVQMIRKSSTDTSGLSIFDGYMSAILSDGKVAVNFRHTVSLNVDTTVSSISAKDDGLWHHVAGVYRRASTLELFVDGVSQGTASIGYASGADIDTNQQLRIGCRKIYGYSEDCFFSGLIDEVAIYNRALGAAEIMDHYQNANPGTIKFQCRADATESGVSNLDFTGPDSTTATYYDSTGTNLGMQFDNKRYLQYRAYFE